MMKKIMYWFAMAILYISPFVMVNKLNMNLHQTFISVAFMVIYGGMLATSIEVK